MKSLNKLKQKKLHVSVIFLLIAFFVLLSISMMFGLLYMHKQKREMLIDISVKNNKEILERYLLEFDNRLEELETYLYSFLYNHNGTSVLADSDDEIELYYAKQELAETLQEIVLLNNTVDGVWICNLEQNQFLLRNAYTGITNQELTAVRHYVIKKLQSKNRNDFLRENKWSLEKIENTYYLIWMTPVKESYCGGWISVPRLYQLFSDSIPLKDTGILKLFSNEEKCLTGENDKTAQTICIERVSEQADIIFSTEMEVDKLLKNAHLSFDYAWFTGVLLFLMLLSFLTYAILVYRPFRRLISELSYIGKAGDPSLRITGDSRLDEIQHLTGSINQFLEESQNLRIQMYEAKLNEKNVNCQYLQIRLKTHFVLNCLSIIHTLVRAKKYDLVEDLVMCLTRYFRFTEFDTQKFVPVHTELEHIRNYAHIQELRFPEVFSYEEKVPESLYELAIPPLILQTFIENSVSHGMSRERPNYVRLSAMVIKENGTSVVHFLIEDNGRGFSESVLNKLSSGKMDSDYSQQHGIGIKNVLSRLNLLYGKKASVSFFNNSEGGASISIKIPYQEYKQKGM